MITVYTTRNCAYCPMVKRYLTAKGVQYQEVDVTDDEAKRDELYSLTGYRAVPVTTDGTSYVVGWKPGPIASMIK